MNEAVLLDHIYRLPHAKANVKQLMREMGARISNRQELEKRLRTRSLDAEPVIQRRLVTASREIENYDKYDYILVNDRLEESIDALKSILLAERLKRSGAQEQGQRSADDTNLMAKAEHCRLNNVRERLQPILASFEKAAAPGGR